MKKQEYDGGSNARLTDMNPDYKFYGMYRGYVIDDEDPRDIGRVKIRVLAVYRTDVEEEDIPWASPAMNIHRSGGNNLKPEMSEDLTQDELKTAYNKTGTGGQFSVPARGNHVWVFFDQGNHMSPNYFAMAPNEDDWLTQKQYVKDKIASKLDDIRAFRDKFKPEDGTAGVDGEDWADGAHVNARQDVTGGGQEAPYRKNAGDKNNNSKSGSTELKKGEGYKNRKLNLDNKDAQEGSTSNMENIRGREWANYPTMDIKPLFDKEDEVIDRSKKPHTYSKDYEIDAGEENGRNVNRFITSKTTQGGTTEIYDGRDGQENYYLIHKNYIENIDQDGSRKVFIGQNKSDDKLVRNAEKDDERNRGPESDIRSNDELAVAGDKKTHVLGNIVEYAKGNKFIQVDKNLQIDVNDTCGVRIKKGDFDIIIEGDEDESRDDDSEREGGKEKGGTPTQHGDLNISIKNGHLELFVKENCNIHVAGMANLMVEGDMRTHVKKSYHMYVEGDYCEHVKGNKYVTVQKNVEQRYNADTKGHVKTEIFGDNFLDIHKNNHLKIGVGGNGSDHLWVKNDKYLTVLGMRRTSIAKSDEIKIGTFYKGEIGSGYDVRIGGGRNELVGGQYELDVGGAIKIRTANTFNLKVSQNVNIQGGGDTYITCPNDLKVIGNVNISRDLKVGGSGSFGSPVYAPDFGANGLSLVRHKHIQGSGNHFGGGGITSPGIGGSVSPKPPITSGTVQSPSAPSLPEEPTIASTGKNDGGGTSMEADPNPINTVFSDEESKLESKNETKLAKRKHKKQSTGRSRKAK